jgi:hypothetical protein
MGMVVGVSDDIKKLQDDYHILGGLPKQLSTGQLGSLKLEQAAERQPRKSNGREYQKSSRKGLQRC